MGFSALKEGARQTQSIEESNMTYQDRVVLWLRACFGPQTGSDTTERAHRFLEEALELAQAAGCSEEDARLLVSYVFNRPSGPVEQEVGGTLVTLAGLCASLNTSMADAGEQELLRNWARIDKIRQKRAKKPPNSALPE